MKASYAAKSDRGDKLGTSSGNRPVVLSIRPRELGSVSTARTSSVTIARRQTNKRREAIITVARPCPTVSWRPTIESKDVEETISFVFTTAR
jgi:hypothetical protein